MSAWKLKKIISFRGTIECVTGISIKGGANDLGIGGADSEVIKNPLTGEPYLPGSSLKGKMRSQLEHSYGAKDKNGNDTEKEPCGCGKPDCPICTIFGAHFNPRSACGPTRILVRDGVFTEAFLKKLQALPLDRGSYLEVKAENIIDRSSGTAKSPRFMERVPAGAEFTLDIQLQIFEGDNETDMVETVKNGLALVEQSYLGNSGSRGYGQVKFHYEISEKVVAVDGKKVTITTKEV